MSVRSERQGFVPLFQLQGKKPEAFIASGVMLDEEVREVCQVISSYNHGVFGFKLRIDRNTIQNMIEGVKEEKRQKAERDGRLAPVGPMEFV